MNFDPAAPGRGPAIIGQRYLVTPVDREPFRGAYVGVVFGVAKPRDTLAFRRGDELVHVAYGRLLSARQLAACPECGLDESMIRIEPKRWQCVVCGTEDDILADVRTALTDVYGDHNDRERWLRARNPLLGWDKPLQRIVDGDTDSVLAVIDLLATGAVL